MGVVVISKGAGVGPGVFAIIGDFVGSTVITLLGDEDAETTGEGVGPGVFAIIGDVVGNGVNSIVGVNDVLVVGLFVIKEG